MLNLTTLTHNLPFSKSFGHLHFFLGLLTISIAIFNTCRKEITPLELQFFNTITPVKTRNKSSKLELQSSCNLNYKQNTNHKSSKKKKKKKTQILQG
jgi:hypothetical protein